MVIIGIVVGVVGEGLIVLIVLLEKCIKNFFVYFCVKMIVVIFILCVCEFILL